MLKTQSSKPALESAVLLLSISFLFYTMPILLYLMDFIFGKTNFVIIAGIVLFYSFILRKLNMSYFRKKGVIGELTQRFTNESAFINTMGYVVVVVFWLISFVAFFVLLKFLLP